MTRTGYSFHKAYGHVDDVIARLVETGAKKAPISDFCSTFGFVKWDKAARSAGLDPVFGVELPVGAQLGQKRPIVDNWTFLAIDELGPLHRLVHLATSNPGREPMLTYAQAHAAKGVIKIAGERLQVDEADADDPDFYVGMSPSLPKGLFNRCTAAGFQFIAKSDNLYPRQDDKEIYRLALGRRATTQTYPLHILSDDEWHESLGRFVPLGDREAATANRDLVLDRCRATLKKGSLLVPEKPGTLRDLCERSALVDLFDPVYRARLDRELQLISDKGFDDYFHIIADLVAWAKQRMAVGPGRGSSAGSLVCYLLDITDIDPIPHGLLFERFIDVTRADNPDIDLDFDDTRREQVFDYLYERYGRHRVARLGATGSMQPRSALKAVGAALRVPVWEIERALERIPARAAGDERNDALKEFFVTADGEALSRKYPNIELAAKLEGHPSNATRHAAGVLLTNEPIADIVAVDARGNTAMCDLKDAEALGLLKIDILGLVQLSIFQRTRDLIDGQA